jgi:hypothetical protein
MLQQLIYGVSFILLQLIYGVSFILLLMQGLYQKEFWSL